MENPHRAVTGGPFRCNPGIELIRWGLQHQQEAFAGLQHQQEAFAGLQHQQEAFAGLQHQQRGIAGVAVLIVEVKRYQ